MTVSRSAFAGLCVICVLAGCSASAKPKETLVGTVISSPGNAGSGANVGTSEKDAGAVTQTGTGLPGEGPGVGGATGAAGGSGQGVPLADAGSPPPNRADASVGNGGRTMETAGSGGARDDGMAGRMGGTGGRRGTGGAAGATGMGGMRSTAGSSGGEAGDD